MLFDVLRSEFTENLLWSLVHPLILYDFMEVFFIDCPSGYNFAVVAHVADFLEVFSRFLSFWFDSCLLLLNR